MKLKTLVGVDASVDPLAGKRSNPRRKKVESRKLPTDRQIYARVLGALEDLYGGDDWDDPRLVDAMRGWVAVPTNLDELDAFDAQEVARDLAENESFDPRNLLDRDEPRENPIIHVSSDLLWLVGGIAAGALVTYLLMRPQQQTIGINLPVSR